MTSASIPNDMFNLEKNIKLIKLGSFKVKEVKLTHIQKNTTIYIELWYII